MSHSLKWFLALSFWLVVPGGHALGDDTRDIARGLVIPDEGYCDQPYIVVTKQGHWLCTLTTGAGVEGQAGQHVVSTISRDQGQTWSPLVDIEPATGPEASWVMPLLVPDTGRVYAFYTYNSENLREVPAANHAGVARRVDTLGEYAFKYTDDGGRTWSAQRYTIPMRLMRIDRENGTEGRVLLFWGVGKPIVQGQAMYLGFSKVGKWGVPGTLVRSQACFLRSDNILTEPDAAKLQFTVLPEGDNGLLAPKGRIAEESNLVGLADGSLYATYRTVDGYPCHAYSRDQGRTWTPRAYMTYGPPTADGTARRIKHPRAANFVKQFSNGKYLYWFHNQGGEPVHASAWDPYQGRNPAWVCGGVERDGFIHWSQPEILIYDRDETARISYPDFIEDDGRYFVTETQKTVARVHEIDPALLEAVWTQHERKTLATEGLAGELASAQSIAPGTSLALPHFAALDQPGSGVSLDFWIWFDELVPGQVVLDGRDAQGRGLLVRTTDRSTLEVVLSDGKTTAAWDSDPGTHEGTLRTNAWQHVVVTVDGGPRLISFVVDGTFNDGGAVRQYGWGRFPALLVDINGAAEARVATSLQGRLRSARVYNRPLLTTEAVGNYRAGGGEASP